MRGTAMQVIAHFESDFKEKFGIPRQAGLSEGLGRIVFVKEYRTPDAVRGLEEYSHLWIIWEFSENLGRGWSATVRPPRLGGNVRKGVFATRAPFRPNPIGLSCVRIQQVILEDGGDGPVILVRGADLLDQTPIYDIKPYIPYADSHPDATGGFTDKADFPRLKVAFPAPLAEKLPVESREPLTEALSQDPRPAYQEDPERIYGMAYAGYNVRFRVQGDLLTVVAVEPLQQKM